MKRLPLFLLLFLLISCALPAQTPYGELLNTYRERLLPEKVYVHTDKNIYAGGETVWAGIYLVDGQTHQPDSTSKLIHLELHDPAGDRLLHRKVFARDGHAASDLTLPATLTPGVYQLTAYTNYQRNSGEEFLFRKPLRILGGLPESGGVAGVRGMNDQLVAKSATRSATRLRFFPEGGDCVTGLPCRVAVVAEAENGAPRSVAATVNGVDGRELARLQTSSAGTGSFTYTPLPGEATVAAVGEQTFPLPVPLPAGIHLGVTAGADTVAIGLRGSSPGVLTGATFVLHLRGLPLAERVIPAGQPRADFLFIKDQLPAGILTATVFDAAGEPVAERLFFVPPADTNIDIDLGKRRPRPLREVELSLSLPDDPGLTGEPLDGGRISLSVLPLASTGGPTVADIRSYLLISSDLDRPLSVDPELLFGDTPEASRRQIDEFLLTRGWRRFRWEKLAAGYDTPPEFWIEDGIYLHGRMKEYDYQTDPRPGKVFLGRLSNAYLEERMTDREGNFAFGPYAVFDTFPVTVQGRSRGGRRKEQSPDITLDDNNYVYLETYEPEGPTLSPYRAPVSEDNSADPVPEENYADISRKALTVARTYDSLIIDLAVVDISARRIDTVEMARNRRTALYGQPDSRVVLDDFGGRNSARSFLDLIRTVPGVVVTGTLLQPSVSIRGVTSISLTSVPLIILDGFPVPLDIASTVPIEDIEFVDVLKGGRTAIYGSQGANGVILIYTRQGGGTAVREPGLINAQVNGYHRAREFAEFINSSDGRPDLRTTLHWAPLLRTDERGRTTTTFSTSEQTGRFLIIAQGLRPDGRPCFGSQEFTVEPQP